MAVLSCVDLTYKNRSLSSLMSCHLHPDPLPSRLEVGLHCIKAQAGTGNPPTPFSFPSLRLLPAKGLLPEVYGERACQVSSL